jgi:hypothetical protein
MLPDREMRDGCDRCAMIGNMSRMLNNNYSRMRKKKNVKGCLITEI